MSHLRDLLLFFGTIFWFIFTVTSAREYTRCELLHELNNKYELPVVEAVRLTCGVRHLTDLKTDFYDEIDGNRLIGIFGIPEAVGCVQCINVTTPETCAKQFRDDDISDDLNCVKFLYDNNDNVGTGIDFRNLPRYDESNCERRIKGYITDCFGNSRDHVIELLAPLSTTEATAKSSFRWSTSTRPTTSRTTIGSRGRNKIKYRPTVTQTGLDTYQDLSNELHNDVQDSFNSAELTTLSTFSTSTSEDQVTLEPEIVTEKSESPVTQPSSSSEETSTISPVTTEIKPTATETTSTVSSELNPVVGDINPPSRFLVVPFTTTTVPSPIEPEKEEKSTTHHSNKPCSANACDPLSSPTKQPLSTVFSFIINNFESVLEEPCEWVTLFNKTYEFSYTDVLRWSCVGYDLIMCEREKVKQCGLNCSSDFSSQYGVNSIDRCGEIGEGVDGALSMVDPRSINGTLLNGLNLCGSGKVDERVLHRYCIIEENGLKTRPEPLPVDYSDGIEGMISMIMSVEDSYNPESTTVALTSENPPTETPVLDNEVSSDTCDYLLSSFRANLTVEQKISWLCYIYATIDCRASNQENCFSKTCETIDDYNIQNDPDCGLFISYINNLVENNIEILAAIKDRPVRNCYNAAAVFISDCILRKDPTGFINPPEIVFTEPNYSAKSDLGELPPLTTFQPVLTTIKPELATTTTQLTTPESSFTTPTTDAPLVISSSSEVVIAIEPPARDLLLPKEPVPEASVTTTNIDPPSIELLLPKEDGSLVDQTSFNETALSQNESNLTSLSSGDIRPPAIEITLPKEDLPVTTAAAPTLTTTTQKPQTPTTTTEIPSSAVEISTLGTIIVPELTSSPLSQIAVEINNMQYLNSSQSLGTSFPEGVNMSFEAMAAFRNINSTADGNCELLQVFNSVSTLSDHQLASWFCYAYDTMWCTIAHGRAPCNASCTTVEDRIVRYDPLCEGRFNVIRKAGEQMKLLLEGNTATYNDKCQDHAMIYVVRCLQGSESNPPLPNVVSHNLDSYESVENTTSETEKPEYRSISSEPSLSGSEPITSGFESSSSDFEPNTSGSEPSSLGSEPNSSGSKATTTPVTIPDESSTSETLISLDQSIDIVPTTSLPLEEPVEMTTIENSESRTDDLDGDPLKLLEFSSLADRINLLKNLYAKDNDNEESETTEPPLAALPDIDQVSYVDRINLLRHIYSSAEVDTNLIFPLDMKGPNQLGSDSDVSNLFEHQLLKDVCQIHKALETNQEIPEVEKESWFCFSYDALKCFVLSQDNCSSVCDVASELIRDSPRCQPLISHIERLATQLKPLYRSEFTWQTCSTGSQVITDECVNLDIKVIPTNPSPTALSTKGVSPTTYRPPLASSTLIGAPVHEVSDEPDADLTESNASIFTKSLVSPPATLDQEERSLLSSTKSNVESNIYNLFIQNAKATSKVNFTVGLDKVLIKDIVITPNEQDKHFDVTFRLHNSAEDLNDDKDTDLIIKKIESS